MVAKQSPVKVEISPKTIVFAVLFILSLWFLIEIKTIIIALLISILLATAVNPLVKRLELYRIPRPLSGAVILILSLGALLAALASLLPPIITQSSLLIRRLPDYLEQLGVSGADIPGSVSGQLGTVSGNLLRFAVDTFSVSIFIFTIFVMSFYLIQERNKLDNHLKVVFGSQADRYRELIAEIETKLGQWVRSILLLMIIVGSLTYVGLTLIGIDYALPLAIIAGLLEVVPNLGPTIATIPAAIIGFSISPLHGVLVILLSILVQQLENNLIVPQVMRSTIGLHPIITIIAILIGFELGGAVLAILSLPIVLIIQVSLHRFVWKEHLLVK